MKPRKAETPQRKPRRRWRWHVPPAILHGVETLEGTEVLDEFGGELGLVFWQSLRDVSLWSSITPPDARAGLFSAEAGNRRAASLLAADPDSQIAGALATIASILEDPAGTASEPVMLACREVSQWAEANGTQATALAFAQAAALACPGNAAAGLRVGMIARRKGELARAETWFRRTIGLARQSRDWASYAEAFASLASLYEQRGNIPVARTLYVRALRASKRHSLRPIMAHTFHHLFTIAAMSGRKEEAQAFARSAFEAYDPENPRVPGLAHDVASFWMEELGQFDPALSVFQTLVPQMPSPEQRVIVLGNIARSAGAVGDRGTYSGAREDLWKMVRSTDTHPNTAQALLDLARGAASLADWPEAEKAARASIDIAERLQVARVSLSAQAILESIANERYAESVPPRTEESTEVGDFATDLVRTLEEHTAVA
ncbi:MAG TPA: tetratricopeptide repeat protein [Longimicrobiaceae bacterium]